MSNLVQNLLKVFMLKIAYKNDQIIFIKIKKPKYL